MAPMAGAQGEQLLQGSKQVSQGLNELQANNNKLKDNIELNEDDVSRLIEAGRKVLIYYKLEKKLDAYNFDDEFKLLNVVVKY